MKTENDKLKEIFVEGLGQQKDIPDFELMWQIAAERNRKSTFRVWSIAASIVLLVTAGTIAILNHHVIKRKSATQITSWSEPTRVLLPSASDLQLTALSHWTSPTRLLLPDKDYPKK